MMMIVAFLTWFIVAHRSVAQTRAPVYNFDVEVEEPTYAVADDEDNIKELFFRRMRGYNSETYNTESSWNYSGDIPQPGGFRDYETKRGKRETGLVNSTEIEDNKVNQPSVSSEEGVLRLKREAQPDAKQSARTENISKRLRPSVDELEGLDCHTSKTNQQETGKLFIQEDNNVAEGYREPRGATKEQWIKQPYPVQPVNIEDNNYEDNIPSSSNIRPPRVHFVTQRRLESVPKNNVNFRSTEREGRTRDYSKDTRASPRIPPYRKPERDYYLERVPKHYNPYPPPIFNPYHDDPYFRYEESRYEPQYDSLDYDRYRPEYTNRKRRIIYYATLPEVVRSPPNVNLRDRYSYRDRYDDRYVTSPSLSAAEGGYRFRKPYPFSKSRYEQDMERTKGSYPLKVSTDVNVKETKKNPERRIYSEPDRRYAYKAPSYHSEESFEPRS